MKLKQNYRVFISYSHKDQDFVLAIRDVLHANGFIPMLDVNFAFGVGFHDQIKNFITHSHVFMPIITKESGRRGWVHQEIGYAMAQNVPVLPVAIGFDPGEMLQTLHAVSIPQNKTAKSNLRRLKGILSKRVFDNLVRQFRNQQFASCSCAELQEDRTQMMTDFANLVQMIQESTAFNMELVRSTKSSRKRKSKPINDEGLDVRSTSMVRQKGGLSSFHIPDKPLTAKNWQRRYGKRRTSRHHCRLQRGERQALEAHARASGCKIIVNHKLQYVIYGDKARVARLQELLCFLEGSQADVKIALDESMHADYSLTLVGDWFCAEATTKKRGVGYAQTVFTRHAPSMQARIDEFEEDFRILLNKRNWTPKGSRRQAIEEIRKEIKIALRKLKTKGGGTKKE